MLRKVSQPTSVLALGFHARQIWTCAGRNEAIEEDIELSVELIEAMEGEIVLSVVFTEVSILYTNSKVS